MKGSTLLCKVINWFQQFLKVLTENAEVVDYSSKALALLNINWGLKLLYGLYSRLKGSDGNGRSIYVEHISHVYKVFPKQLAFLGG